MITQRDLDLIADAEAFNPPLPDLTDHPGFRVLNAVCWVLLAVISVATAAVIGCPVGWLVG